VDHLDLILGRFLFLPLLVVLQNSNYLGYLQTLLFIPVIFGF